MTAPAPLAIAYTAPLRGRGAMGLILTGILSLIVLLAGALGQDFALLLLGLGGMIASGVGLWLYHSAQVKREFIRLYPDRLEFLRGPQKGSVAFADLTGVQGMQWGGSIYPVVRTARFLVLQTPDAEWHIGPEIRDTAAFQEQVIEAIQASRSAAED
jgi:hypothetical protein